MSLVNRAALKKYILRMIKARGNPIITKAYTRVSASALDDYEFELQRMIEYDVGQLRANGSKTFRRPNQ